MIIKRVKEIDWLVALDRLSPGAYYLLSTLWYKDLDVNDDTMRNETKVGISTHRRHKNELCNAGYLKNKQIGKGKYIYYIGEQVG